MSDPDRIDPLAPRPDDPVWGWRRRLYDRPDPSRSLLRTPLAIALILVTVGMVALGVVLLGARAG
jgi:hypothetical protein